MPAAVDSFRIAGEIFLESGQGYSHVDIGFIGLGNMGFPIARRLVDSNHDVVVYDSRAEAVASFVAVGGRAAASARGVADQTETVMASLPSLTASLDVATGANGVIEGSRVKRFVDFSTVGSHIAERIHAMLAERGIATLDCPVSGGVGGAAMGTLAVMVSGPCSEFELLKPTLETIGRPFYIGGKPGAAQTMKLINNMLAATGLAATCEAVVMGAKAGLDPAVMIDVLNLNQGGARRH